LFKKPSIVIIDYVSLALVTTENNRLQIVTLNICRVILETTDKYPSKVFASFNLAHAGGITWFRLTW